MYSLLPMCLAPFGTPMTKLPVSCAPVNVQDVWFVAGGCLVPQC